MKKLTYCLNVHVTIPLTDDCADVDLHTTHSATTPWVKRDLERDLYRLLNQNGFDSDVELIDCEVSE